MERVRMGTPARMYLVLLVSVVVVGLVSHGDATTSPPDQNQVAVSLNAPHVAPGEVQRDTDGDNNTLEIEETTLSPGNQSEMLISVDTPQFPLRSVEEDTYNDNSTIGSHETTPSPRNQLEVILSLDTPHVSPEVQHDTDDDDNNTFEIGDSTPYPVNQSEVIANLDTDPGGHEAHKIIKRRSPPNGNVGTLSPGDQSKVMVSLDVAKFSVDKTHEYYKGQLKVINKLKSVGKGVAAAEKAKILQKTMKAAAAVGQLLTFVSVAGAIFSVVATFLMPSQLDIIKEQFEVVNNKLDAIASQMVSIRNELKSSVEFNTWLTTYIEWELDIQNGEAKLVETQVRLAQLNDKRQKLKLMESYIHYFDNQDIEGKAIKIYKLTALDSSTTRRNLFDLYVKEKGCDVVELSRLMFIIRALMTSAARQAVIYQFLKYGNVDYAREKMTTFYDRLYEIRRQYELHVWYCQRDSVKYAKEEAKKVIETHKQASKEALSKILHGRLSELMPWYEWAVVLYKQAPSVTIRPILDNLPSVTVQFSDLSGQFFTLTKVGGNDDINILVVWQDISDESHGCQDTVDANTFVPFQFHSENNNDVLTSSDHMITGKECINSMRDIVSGKIHRCNNGNLNCNSRISNILHRDKYSFVAAGFSKLRDPCSSHDVCNNHGICRHIPHTSQHLCLCHEYFEGDNCQDYHDPAKANSITDMVASLRQKFSEFIGVPTVVDVYLSIKDIPNEIKLVRQRIMASIKYTQIVALYGKVFNDAEYVTVAYKQLQSGEISEEIYDHRVKGINFHRIISDLKKVILGQGILIQYDFLSVFKKSLISESGSQVACTQSYSKAVSHMINTLVTLDEAVTEATLWASHWRVQQMTGPKARETVDGAQRVLKAAQRRRGEYTAYWEGNSCPKLTTNDLQQRHCDARHSYQGLKVSLTCANRKQPSPSSVTCTKSRHKMQWSATPQCVYVWGSWSSWSSCSKTCGGGQRTRRRSKHNGETKTLKNACNTQDCCQAKYGKFKCSNGRCVRRSDVCDGDNNCGDSSDEARSRCSYLRVGDTIALRNHCRGKGFLSCSCSVNCGKNCRTQTCPGTSMDSSDWKNCGGEVFNYITAIGRKNGEAIRHGDVVAMRYGWNTGDRGWWLSCWGRGSYCKSRPCPGKHFTDGETNKCRGEIFWIYSYNKRGSCGTDTYSGCKGKPLHPGDVVYIRYSTDKKYGGYWLSGHYVNYDVLTRTCPGRYIDSNDLRSCICEKWTLFRR